MMDFVLDTCTKHDGSQVRLERLYTKYWEAVEVCSAPTISDATNCPITTVALDAGAIVYWFFIDFC